MTTNIQVICRFRPLPNPTVQSPIQFLSKETLNVDGTTFSFDHIFSPGQQSEIYAVAAEPVVKGVLEGINGTVVAYGQTASGKTHTMNGGEGPGEEGIIRRTVGTVFDYISKSPENLEFRMKVSVVEIYMEKIRDLLFPQKMSLKIREDKAKGVYIQDVTEIYVSEEQEIFDVLKSSAQNRQISHTNMNDQSSRSHMIFLLNLTVTDTQTHSARSGKLFLVDLAGSEKVSKTGAEGRTLDEAKGINKSLMALGQVIHALTSTKKDVNSHVPYRISKLTRILQCSFGGNSKTNLIITCSQEPSNLQETISTLRFGTIAKTIRNQPKVNREYTVEELKALCIEKDLEIQRLRTIIAAKELNDSQQENQQTKDNQTAILQQFESTPVKEPKVEVQQFSGQIQPLQSSNKQEIQPIVKQEVESPKPIRVSQDRNVESKLVKKCQILEQNLEGLLKQFYEVIMIKSQWQIEYEILQRKVQYMEALKR